MHDRHVVHVDSPQSVLLPLTDLYWVYFLYSTLLMHMQRVCSGSGKCHCGQCLCTDYRVRTGKYCDICPVSHICTEHKPSAIAVLFQRAPLMYYIVPVCLQRCIEACSHLGECVVCQVQGLSDCQDLCRNLSLVYNRTVVEESQEYMKDPLRRCLVESGSCQLPFYLDGLLLGTESGINIFVDSTDSAYQRIRSSECDTFPDTTECYCTCFELRVWPSPN